MTPLSSFQARPDLRIISFSTSGNVMTVPEGGFSACDVGKSVVLPGTSKLRTTVSEFLSSTELRLAATPPAPIGGLGFIGSDCTPALQSAVLSAEELEIDGHYLLMNPIVRDSTAPLAMTAGRLALGTPDTSIAISLANGRIWAERTTFVGLPGAPADARQLLRFAGARATVRDCGFYWLAVSLADGAVVAGVGGCDLMLEENDYRGCTSPNAVVYAAAFQGFTAQGESFLDLGTIDGRESGRLVNAPAAAWIKVGDPQFPAISATAQGVVLVKNCRMDEGAVAGLIVAPTTPGTRVAHVHVDGLEQASFNGPNGKGVCITAADHVKVERSRIGTFVQTAALHDGMYFYDCGDVEILDNVTDAPAARITANHLASFKSVDSYGYDRELTDAGVVTIIEHGREITPPAPPPLISDNSHAIVTGRVVELDASAPAAWQNAAHTSSGFNGGQDFVLQAKILTLANGMAFGFTTLPLVAASYSSNPIAVVPNGPRWNAVYGGTPHDIGPAAVGDVIRLEHRDGIVTFKINGVQAGPTTPSLWGQSSVIYGDVNMVGTISGKVSIDAYDLLPA